MPVAETFSTGSSQVIIWHINESLNHLKTLAEDKGIDTGEIDDYLSELRQKQWLAVRLCCNQIVPNQKIQYEKNGRPYLEDAKLSISHSNEFVAISINNNHDTGIDLQIIDEKILRVYHKFVREDEDQWAMRNLKEATIIWSVKEAMYKLYGDCSPYFKQDYQVRKTNDKYSCIMKYKQKEIIKDLIVFSNARYITAIVND